MGESLRRAGIVFALGCLAHSSHAITISYELTHLGGTSYQYEYTVTNDGSIGIGVPIDSFSVYFDTALYSEASLLITSESNISSSWDEIFLGSGVGLPAAYDALALNSGITVGSALSGFSVEFIWLGVGTLPGSQLFEIFDPVTFNSLAIGRTAIVPIPPAILLLVSALALLTLGRSNSSHQNRIGKGR